MKYCKQNLFPTSKDPITNYTVWNNPDMSMNLYGDDWLDETTTVRMKL